MILENKYGQEIQAGDFVIATHQKGTTDFYLVRGVGEKKTRIMLKRFWATDLVRNPVTGRWTQVGYDQREVCSEDTFVNFPEDVFKTSLKEYQSIDPLVCEAYIHAQREILEQIKRKESQ